MVRDRLDLVLRFLRLLKREQGWLDLVLICSGLIRDRRI